MIEVQNRWALITGASRGIGKELAIFMAKQGCNLILHSRTKSHLAQVDTEVRALGVRTQLVQGELEDLEAINHMLAEIDALKLQVDFIFNNAGVQIAYRVDYYDTPMSDYDISFKINTIAPMKICYHFLPKMIHNGFGRIINTTSGIDQEPEQGGYSASKAALDKVTKDIGCKLDPKSDVIISLFDPGWCKTDLGGEKAPNEISSTIPGSAIGAFITDGISGRIIEGQEYVNLTLEQALRKLQGNH